MKGRVGDAPLIGCVGYANKTGGATVTGFGESIMKVTLAREVVYNMENGQNAQVRFLNLQFNGRFNYYISIELTFFFKFCYQIFVDIRSVYTVHSNDE